VGKKENKKTVTEYYHRGVVASLAGFDLPIVLDIEMIGRGEGEIVAAKRLLERLMNRYARFFDAVQGDAIYWEAPLFELCRKHDKRLLAVLKENNPALLNDAKALLQGKPDLTREEDGRLIHYWDQEGFTSGSIQTPIRVLHTEETQRKRERIARKWVESEPVSNWFWATDIPQSLIPSRQLCQAGHGRWGIENFVFNDLGEHWALDHCFHHNPAAILNFILILFIAHILVTCFYRFNLKKAARRIFSTAISLAKQIFLGIISARAKDIPWRHAGGRSPPKT
jgi:hypothetical protein